MALKSALVALTRTGTGTVRTGAARVRTITLTPAAAASTVIIRDGGGAGTIRATLAAPANGNSVMWNSDHGIQFATDVHATLTGSGVRVDVGLVPLD